MKAKKPRPSMSVFGLTPNSSFYIPHYLSIPEVYKNSRIIQLQSKSVMFTRNAWDTVDFWNSDADVLYAEDSLSFVEALNTSGNHYAYFEPFLKLYRVAHGNVLMKTLGKDRNDHHVLDILSNFLRSDVIWVSDILNERLQPVLKDHFSLKVRKQVQEKIITLPYPAFYKAGSSVADVTNVDLRISSKKPLVFLWNHRLVESKNFKDFCWILTQVHERYSEIDFKILFVCAEPESSCLNALPEVLRPKMDYRGFIADPVEYGKAIREANITIATSKLESFGNAVFDSIANGILLINQDCNSALTTLLGGTTTTFAKKDIPDIICTAYQVGKVRRIFHEFNVTGMDSHPNRAKHYSLLSARLQDELGKKMAKAPKLAKSRVVADALKALDEGSLTKRELYKAIGWSTGKNPLNAHWSGYYYALRREGVRTSLVDGQLYFHKTVKANVKTTTLKQKPLW